MAFQDKLKDIQEQIENFDPSELSADNIGVWPMPVKIICWVVILIAIIFAGHKFIISELQTAFMIGFILYIPFLVIDMIVASILMSMGMMMLPPIMISLPFKLVLFVLVDGWHLIAQQVITSFR